jgi:hypothetical protein
LNSGVYFGASDVAKAFDNSVFTRVDTNTNTCELGMEFPEGYVGSLQQVKYFINYIDKREQYEENLIFEGSADKISWTALFTVGANVHEGWNYVDFEQGSYPNYRFYRFRGLGGSNGPCRIHELTFKGNEVIQDTGSSYSCTPRLVLGEQTYDLNSVTFEGSKTALIETIEPRFGSVQGGDAVTFSGSGFVTGNSKYTILIDGVECSVT